MTQLVGRDSATKEIINTSLTIYLLKQYKIGYRSVLSTLTHTSTVQNFCLLFYPSQKLMQGFCLRFSLLLQSKHASWSKHFLKSTAWKCSNPLLSWQNSHFSILHEIRSLYGKPSPPCANYFLPCAANASGGAVAEPCVPFLLSSGHF